MDPLAIILELIETATGFRVLERDRARIEKTVAERRRALGNIPLDRYAEMLRRSATGREWRALLATITIKESYLFRGERQLAVLRRKVLPDLLDRHGPEHPLRVLSAGCARGEEPATLAILLAEERRLSGRRWEVVGIDIDEAALEIARRGVFGPRAVSRAPSQLLQRYFAEAPGPRYRLRPSLMRHLRFAPMNLVQGPLAFADGAFDIVFMRNVLIYFGPETQRRVVEEMARVLAADGWLFLGPSETLWTITDALKPVDLGGAFAYRHPAWAREERGRKAPGAPPPVPPGGGTGPRAGSARRPARPDVAQPAGDAAPDRAVDAAVDSLANGSPRRCLELVERLIPVLGDHPELHTLKAVALSQLGDHRHAIESLRAALYLDPSLFQVRFLLAEAFSRAGMQVRADKEYRRVLESMAAPGRTALSFEARLGLPGPAEVEAGCRRALAGGGGEDPPRGQP